jgi:hypothetical protein
MTKKTRKNDDDDIYYFYDLCNFIVFKICVFHVFCLIYVVLFFNELYFFIFFVFYVFCFNYKPKKKRRYNPFLHLFGA